MSIEVEGQNLVVMDGCNEECTWEIFHNTRINEGLTIILSFYIESSIALKDFTCSNFSNVNIKARLLLLSLSLFSSKKNIIKLLDLS